MEKTKIRSSISLNKIEFLALVLFTFPISCHEKQKELIYILLWTYTSNQGWIYRDLEMGQEAFTSRNCSFQNCFVTTNHSYLDNLLDYDVLMFNVIHYAHFVKGLFPIPPIRSEAQQYILSCFEPAGYSPLPDYLNGIFNLTWTYKLNSDIVHPYIIIKNNNDQVIGPKRDVHWLNMNDLPPINSSIIQKLKNKRIAAVWVGSDCFAKDRIIYILKLENELKSKYGLKLDIFGECGNESVCSRVAGERAGLLSRCYDKVESDYYFYLAFENSISEDYVSEKVLHGLNHFTVPVVYGGADYRRFMPDGIYLDAIKLGIEGLAKEMYDIINDPPRYNNFFKWHGFYTFHDTAEDNYRNAVCELCAFLNNEKRKHNKTVRVYESIVNWWNVPRTQRFPSNFAFRFMTEEAATSANCYTEEPKVPEPETPFFSKLLNFLIDD